MSSRSVSSRKLQPKTAQKYRVGTGQRLQVKIDIHSSVIKITKSSAIDAIVQDIVHRNVVSNIQNATTVMSGDRLKSMSLETHAT